MFKGLKNKRGQPSLEITVLIAIVAAALLATQVYMKRGLQGKLKESADQMGTQFSPGYTIYSITSTRGSTTRESVNQGVISSNIIGSEIMNRTGNVTTPVAAQEYWGR